MQNKKIVIHIGLPKTATTFLQNEFFPKLNGVTYIGRPYTQENYAFNNIQFADRTIYSASSVKKEFNKIICTSNQNTILISDELFSGFPLYNYINRGIIAERLADMAPKAEIILFLRSQVDLIASLYNQYVKIGWVSRPLDESFLHNPGKGLSLEKWFDGQRKWNKKNRFISHRSFFNVEHFKYSKIYSLYENLFSKVHVILYEDFISDKEKYLNKIESILSLESSIVQYFNTDTKVIINQSLNNRQLQKKIIENRIRDIFPGIGDNYLHYMSTVINRISKKETFVKNREYVSSVLKENGVIEDNRILNDKIKLGMDHYYEKYFDMIV